jgi:two-component SAPR family response regulator
MMPELDGYQLAEKALALNPNLKIILASGFNSYLAEKNPLKSLPKINKPYPSQQLLELVSTLLDSTIDKKSIPTP